MKGLLLAVLLCVTLTLAQAWKRSALIYNNNDRDMDAWKRHVMRIDSRGSYTGQWLFDAAILSAEKVNRKDIYYGCIAPCTSDSDFLNGQDLSDLNDLLIRDASNMEQAIQFLVSSQVAPAPPTRLQIFIGFPYLHPANRNLNIQGNSYDISNADRRLSATKWIVEDLLAKLRSRDWNHLNFGIYYHREDVLTHYNDAAYIKKLNDYVHERGMTSTWVPYYDVPDWAFNGTDLGFDHNVIQPRYSFLSSIDAGILKADRLYSTGFKAAGQGQCLEYEARSQGESELEYHMAHQYLSISQLTGASQFEQVFFLGNPDIFDKVTGQAGAKGKMWETYTDLADYLGGAEIWNMEVGIDHGAFRDVPGGNVKELRYTVEGDYLQNLNSIRMDFNDPNQASPWRGGLTVLVQGDRGRSSFAYRVGTDDINPSYDSVFVPLSNFPIPPGTTLHIQLFREEGSPWPNIIRLVAAKYEPLFVANPAFASISSSSAPVPTSSYQDSQPTHLQFASGKLTDGRSNPEWWMADPVGWSHLEKRVTITIDLGSVREISSVRVLSYNDIASGIGWPRRVGFLTATDCEPQERGTLNGCIPNGSSGTVEVNIDKASGGSFCDRVTLTGKLGAGARARYVTISMVAIAWCILDEVQVLDGRDAVISNGRPYRVTPVPGNYYDRDGRDLYSSDGQNLADGAIFRDFVFGRNVIGFPAGEEGTVELSWVKPLGNLTWAVVWMTNARPDFGIGLPPAVSIQWRDGNTGNWRPYQTVSVSGINLAGVCTASPCAALRLPQNARVTGVRGKIPSNTGSWTMVSEISLI